jgi:hypothetical protein
MDCEAASVQIQLHLGPEDRALLDCRSPKQAVQHVDENSRN